MLLSGSVYRSGEGITFALMLPFAPSDCFVGALHAQEVSPSGAEANLDNKITSTRN